MIVPTIIHALINHPAHDKSLICLAFRLDDAIKILSIDPSIPYSENT